VLIQENAKVKVNTICFNFFIYKVDPIFFNPFLSLDPLALKVTIL